MREDRREKREVAGVFSRAAASYGRVGADFFAHFGKRLVHAVGLAGGMRVLDVAAGAGAITLPAAECVGVAGRVVAVDIAPGMIARLGTEVRARGLGQVVVGLMDAEDLALAEETFDAVLCGFALDSLPDPDRALAEFRRVLVSGGRLGMTISSGWWWEGDDRWRWHAELLEALGVATRSGRSRFASPEDVRHDLQRVGFVDVIAWQEDFILQWADSQQWWAWTWSHGYRRILESMHVATLERYRADCFAHLARQQPARGIQGRLEVLLALGLAT